MQALRKNAKQFIMRSGLGRFRPYVDAISAYSKYGDWLKQNSSVRMFGERERMYDFLNAEIVRDEPVDYLEFGVYQGYTIKYWSTINANPDSRFFGFDSFEGLPEDWSGAFVRVPKGTFNTEGMIPQVDDPRVSFQKGWFQDSLPLFLESFESRNRLLIHCDADLYTSTLFVLCTLHNRLKPGSLIVFDEFSGATDEFRDFHGLHIVVSAEIPGGGPGRQPVRSGCGRGHLTACRDPVFPFDSRRRGGRPRTALADVWIAQSVWPLQVGIPGNLSRITP